MEISSRKSLKRMQEPVDDWLQEEGYYRKHTPKDPTCLFRAVSEQIYMTQYFHLKVRKECVQFMRVNRHLFEQYIPIPFEMYLEQMTCFTEWGGHNEIKAMALLYKRDIIVFNGQKQVKQQVTNNGFKNMLYLCHVPPRQYQSVFTREFVAAAAYCQSLIYQTLYKGVFDMVHVENTVHKMLHERSNFRHDKFFLKGNIEIRKQLTAELYNKVEQEAEDSVESQMISKGIMPFPYRVAKALDPNIYRNIDYDIWHEIKREVKNAGWISYNNDELQVGGKCLVEMNFNENDYDRMNNNSYSKSNCNDDNEKCLKDVCKQEPIVYCGHIQEMSKNDGPVLVFIEELGEKRTVPFSALKPLPIRNIKQITWRSAHKKNIHTCSTSKWKKLHPGNNRNTREIIQNSDNTLNSNTPRLNSNRKNRSSNNNNNERNKIDITQCHGKQDQHNLFQNSNKEKNSHYNNLKNNLSGNSEVIKQHFTQNEVKECSESNLKIIDNNILITREYKNSSSKSSPIATVDNEFSFSKQKLQDTNNSSDSLPVITSQSNSYYVGVDNSSQAISPYVPANCREFPPPEQIERMMRLTNCSDQKCITGVTTNELPISDPCSLRYSCNLEYFHGSYVYNWGTTAQAMNISPWCYNNQISVLPINCNTPMLLGGGAKTEENMYCHNNRYNEISDHRNESVTNHIPINSYELQSDNSLEFNSLSIQEDSLDNSVRVEENNANPNQKNREKNYANNKESYRSNRNTLGPRFKKNFDYQRQNTLRLSNHTQQQNQPRTQSASLPNQKAKYDNANDQHVTSLQPQNHISSSNSCPYIQQPMFSSVPLYGNETEMFGPPCYTNGSFYPVSYVSPSTEGTTQSCVQYICPNGDNHALYPALYSPYMFPQQTMYAPLPPSNNPQEQWYQMVGHSRQIQYTTIPTQQLPELPQNISNQNTIQNGSG